MPDRDGTGPLGQGAATGRGLGGCKPSQNGTGSTVGRGRGRGGMGRGLGLGLGTRSRNTEK